jgi:hypothetical protein
MIYDQEEHDIVKAYETEQMNMQPPSEQELAAIKAAADNTFKEERPPFHGKTIAYRP